MKKSQISTIVVTALSFIVMNSACSSDGTESPVQQKQRIPLTLNATISNSQEPLTRSYTGDDADTYGTQSTSIYAGQTVWAWGNMTSNDATHFSAWQLTARGAGQLSTTDLNGSSHYYPDENQSFYITAVHGNFSETISESSLTALPATLTHTVLADQSTADSYAQSDLLYAKLTDITVPEPLRAQTLQFAHMLSKIEITLIPGSDPNSSTISYSVSDLSDATVDIINVTTDATLTMSNGNVAAGSTTGSVRVKKSTDTSVGVTESGAAAANYNWLEAVLPFQTIAATTAFIRVTLPSHNNRTLYYQAPTGGITLAKGTRYRFVFTVTPTVIKLSALYYQSSYEEQTIEVVPEA